MFDMKTKKIEKLEGKESSIFQFLQQISNENLRQEEFEQFTEQAEPLHAVAVCFANRSQQAGFSIHAESTQEILEACVQKRSEK